MGVFSQHFFLLNKPQDFVSKKTQLALKEMLFMQQRDDG
jgi:hypothetical protein